MPVRLHVNIDHVATLRQARGTRYPDPVHAAQICEDAGADGITLHLREDRRHIIDRDVVTCVPERAEERTTEAGLDVVGNRAHLSTRVARLRDAGIKVSFFIGADEAQVEASHALGAKQVEFHTGPYAHAKPGVARDV